MDKATEITEELKTISPVLAAMEKVNVFQAPEGYFIDLDKRVLTSVFLHQDEKNNYQKVPEGYFDTLSHKIISKIKSGNSESAKEEIKTISPALHYLKEENVFTVPENYFEHLGDRILEKIHPEPGKVVAISSVKKWWKYAVAAVVAGVIAISSLQLFNNNSVPDQKETVATSLNMPDYEQLASEYKTPEQLDKGIASLSDEEIVTYLEKHGNIMDNELLIKNINTKALPDADDYLIDENTLNNFLKTIDAESSNKNTQ